MIPRRIQLPLVLLFAGLVITTVHDYAYRRVDDGKGDYELGGLVTHAGADMISVAVVLALVALAWNWKE